MCCSSDNLTAPCQRRYGDAGEDSSHTGRPGLHRGKRWEGEFLHCGVCGLHEWPCLRWNVANVTDWEGKQGALLLHNNTFSVKNASIWEQCSGLSPPVLIYTFLHACLGLFFSVGCALCLGVCVCVLTVAARLLWWISQLGGHWLGREEMGGGDNREDGERQCAEMVW